MREAEAVEPIALVFRANEMLSEVKGDGPARFTSGAPRLTHCLKSKWRGGSALDRIAVVNSLSDFLLSNGYELAIGKEAEGAAAVLPDDCKRYLKGGQAPEIEETAASCLRSVTVWLGTSATGALPNRLIERKSCFGRTVLTYPPASPPEGNPTV